MGDYSANGNRRLGNIPLPPRALFELEGNLCNEDDSSNWLPYIEYVNPNTFADTFVHPLELELLSNQAGSEWPIETNESIALEVN